MATATRRRTAVPTRQSLCPQHGDCTCPPATSPEHPLRRFLCSVAALTLGLMTAFVTGQLMLASHADPGTVQLVGVSTAAVVVLVGFGLLGRGRRNRGQS